MRAGSRDADLINDTERESITGKTAELREKLEQIRTRRREAMMNMRADRNRNDEIRRETRSSASEEAGIATEISNLSSRLEMPFDAVIGTQVAGAETREALEGDAVSLERTILVAPDGSVRALRHQGKWISAKEVLATSSGGPSQVALKVSGNEGSVYVSCELEWSLPFGKPDCSMVAATTFELESLQGADIAERLSKVEPQAMSSNRTTSTGSRTLQWNGKPTSLWIKIFRNGEPDQPIIDEMILLDYPDRFIAKWGRPPSPLIKGPQPEPDSPPDLAGERATLDAGGSILDMIPAGDGSILMIRTDKPPYWAALDLKSGRFEDLPWKAGPDTLLTAQAGKIHLINRKTKVVEIHDLASKQRTGLQVLQMEGDIVAAAAPLASPDSPLLITTDKFARFVDPANFEVVSTGFDIDASFAGDDKNRSSFPRIDPLSARVRASGDGALYTITAKRMEGGSADSASFTVRMDRSRIAIAENSHEQIMGIRGRRLTDYFSDHGGGDIRVRTVPSPESFPGPPGTIRFTERDGNKVIAELRSAPVVPLESRKRAGVLPYDRTVCYDSSLGVLVLPDDTKIHILHIKLPEQAQARPDFVFTGEDVEIPLPPGRDHKLILEPQGETSISGNLAKWKVPAHFDRSQVYMKLEWTGELGTTLTQNFQCAVIRQAPAPIVESPDGKTRQPLRRTGIIAPEAGIYGFAGGGNVMLTSSGSDQEAWSLTTCEKLFSRKESIQAFLGDADQIYLLDDKGVLKSFDIMTGNPLAEAAFGTRDSGSRDSPASRPASPRKARCSPSSGTK